MTCGEAQAMAFATSTTRAIIASRPFSVTSSTIVRPSTNATPSGATRRHSSEPSIADAGRICPMRARQPNITAVFSPFARSIDPQVLPTEVERGVWARRERYVLFHAEALNEFDDRDERYLLVDDLLHAPVILLTKVLVRRTGGF